MTDFIFTLPPAALVPTVTEVVDGQIDHVAAGLSRLYQQFRKPGIIALTAIRLERWNMLAGVLDDLMTKRNIFNATAAQEDLIGRIVLQPRNGLDDDLYRRYLFARIAVNNSNGLIEDFIKVAKLILNDSTARIVVTQPGAAGVYIAIRDVVLPDEIVAVLIDLLRETPLGGVRLLLIWSSDHGAATPAMTFRYDVGPGYNDGLDTFYAGLIE